MLISGHTTDPSDIAGGVALARWVQANLVEEFPDLVADAGFEVFAVPGVPPAGQVDLQIFRFEGCDPESLPGAGTPG